MRHFEYTKHPLERKYREGRLAAVPCGKLKRVPVRIQSNGVTQSQLIQQWGNEPYTWVIVIAKTAADAANWVIANLVTAPNTEVIAIGPKQGEVSRFMGFESFIGREISRPVTCRERNYDLF